MKTQTVTKNHLDLSDEIARVSSEIGTLASLIAVSDCDDHRSGGLSSLLRRASDALSSIAKEAADAPIAPEIHEQLCALADTWNNGKVDGNLMDRIGLAMARTEGAE